MLQIRGRTGEKHAGQKVGWKTNLDGNEKNKRGGVGSDAILGRAPRPGGSSQKKLGKSGVERGGNKNGQDKECDTERGLRAISKAISVD